MPYAINNKNVGCTVQTIWETEFYKWWNTPMLHLYPYRIYIIRKPHHRTPFVDVQGFAPEEKVYSTTTYKKEYAEKQFGIYNLI